MAKQQVEKENYGQKNVSFLGEIYDWMDAVVASLVSVVILFIFIFQIVGIKGPSMQNTLFENDRVIITNLFYTPKKGDVVVISRNITNYKPDETRDTEPIIKRVIATAGQTVDIDFEQGIVYVDGIIQNEPYIREQTHLQKDVQFPLYVKEGYVFVMGDNRNNSTDSRSTQIGDGGLIDTRYILGKAVLRVYPFNSIGIIKGSEAYGS